MASAAPGSFVALLRGINVGGKNMVPMKDLVGMFEHAGCVRVCHYIQSGNVVFGAPAALGARVPQIVEAEIQRRLGIRVPVIVRTNREMRAVVEGNPFLEAGEPLASLHVMFLARAPDEKRCAALDPKRSPPDAFVVRGREIYLCCPNGVARTKLTNAYFDSALATTSTSRNWRTVLKLVEMSSE
jgi:uncharacterized protein (DUF1697 family)